LRRREVQMSDLDRVGRRARSPAKPLSRPAPQPAIVAVRDIATNQERASSVRPVEPRNTPEAM
jgi:hypothetical protein